MSEVVNEVIESLQTTMRPRQIQARCRGDENLTVRGERFLVWHAVQNIVLNAVEFSPNHGEIEISLHSIGDAVEVRCTDEGPGILDDAPVHRLSRPAGPVFTAGCIRRELLRIRPQQRQTTGDTTPMKGIKT